MADQALYNHDFFRWTQEQAQALRGAVRADANLAGADLADANLPVDWENVAEEIESLGRSDRRELGSRIRVILEHLLQLSFFHATRPRAGWQETILRERLQIADLLSQSPSLRRHVPDIIRDQLPPARRLAAAPLARRGEDSPTELTDYTEEQVLGDWLPPDAD